MNILDKSQNSTYFSQICLLKAVNSHMLLYNFFSYVTIMAIKLCELQSLLQQGDGTMLTNQYDELFQENVVVTMDKLKLATGRPRESILRDLKSIGYYSSYNERGKFYTLDNTPKFDALGLWKYQSAYFSSRRTVLSTVKYLLSVSSAGYTHDELRRILGIGIQNSLYQLTTANEIVRQKIGAQYIYFVKENIEEQWEKRISMPIEPTVRKTLKTPVHRNYPDIEPLLIIDILVAVLRGHETDSAVHSYLSRTGSPVTAQQVEAVFRYYCISKKNSPTQN